MAEPKQERAVRTREEILRAAALAFDESGYRGASMRDIMKRAGVTLGAVYFHFESKEALARAVMNAQPQTIMPRVKSSGLQQLVDITLLWAQELPANPLLRAGVRLAVEQESHGIRDDSSFRDWEQIMADSLETARRDGQLRPGTEPRRLAEFVVSACTGIQQHAHLTSGSDDLLDRVIWMWRFLLPGVATDAAAARIDVGRDRAVAL